MEKKKLKRIKIKKKRKKKIKIPQNQVLRLVEWQVDFRLLHMHNQDHISKLPFLHASLKQFQHPNLNKKKLC